MPPGRRPLVVVGPTASGKTALALELARRASSHGERVEIVSADAMAVYRGMDIGTAKPGANERAEVPHHLIDVADPGEDFTVSLFADQATEVLAAIERRGATPVVVGGTGLYVRALVDGFVIPPQYPEVAAELEGEADTSVLYQRLAELDPAAATKMLPANRRRIVRALEVTVGSGRPFSSFGPGVDQYPPTPFLQVGLDIDRTVLDARIDARYDRQLADGFLTEVRGLVDVGLSRSAGQALGYRELLAHLEGTCTLDEALDLARRRTRRFARRQQRWFRRDPRITWFVAPSDRLVDQVAAWWERGGYPADVVGGTTCELRD